MLVAGGRAGMAHGRNSRLQDTHLLPPQQLRYNLPVICVIASVALRPSTLDRYLAELTAVAAQVRAEAGCIEYCPVIDVASGLKPQIPLRPNTVTIVERWASLEALAAHSIAPHMQAFRARSAEYVLDTSLQVLEPANV